LADNIRFVEARGARFAVRCFGSGTPVLALHGGFGTGQVWIEAAEAAAISNVMVMAPDARGHGLSSASPDPKSYATSELAGDAIGIANELGLQKVAFVGSSMGARTAAYIAANQPERVASLGLCLPPPTSHQSGPAQGFRDLAADIQHRGFDTAIEVVRRRNPLVADNMSRMPRETLPAVLAGVVSSEFDVTPDELAQISCPTMVLGREGDPSHRIEDANFYVANIHGAVLKIVPFDLADAARAEVIEWAAKHS
jgi:pimeloyl-ACP methyl ester carboxylesterase